MHTSYELDNRSFLQGSSVQMAGMSFCMKQVHPKFRPAKLSWS